MGTNVVRYRTRPERADENQSLIEAVFAELDADRPEGLRYASFRLADGVSFVHVATVDTADDSNPLTATPAFGRFLDGHRAIAATRPRWCRRPPSSAPTGSTSVRSQGSIDDGARAPPSSPGCSPRRAAARSTRRTGTRRSTRPRWSCRSARPSCATTSRASTICTPCWSSSGDWVPLGNADEQKPAADGTVEAWARAEDNPVGGWYGIKKGLRGRFANYVPPGARAARPGRGRAQPPQQPHARRQPVTGAAAPAGRSRSRRSAIRTDAPSSSSSGPVGDRWARSPTRSRSAGRPCRDTCDC